MEGEAALAVLAGDGTAFPCTVCTILIGPGYYEATIYRDALTGWRVCGSCLASLRRQRERQDDFPRGFVR